MAGRMGKIGSGIKRSFQFPKADGPLLSPAAFEKKQ
jgi:hypothetical protein